VVFKEWLLGVGAVNKGGGWVGEEEEGEEDGEERGGGEVHFVWMCSVGYGYRVQRRSSDCEVYSN